VRLGWAGSRHTAALPLTRPLLTRLPLSLPTTYVCDAAWRLVSVLLSFLAVLGVAVLARRLSLSLELSRGTELWAARMREREAAFAGRGGAVWAGAAAGSARAARGSGGSGSTEGDRLGGVVGGTNPPASSSPPSLSAAPPVIPILIPVYSRVEYLRRVIASLRRNAHINETVLVFSQDGNVPGIAEEIAGIDFAPVVHLRHAPPFWGLPSLILRTDAPTASNIHFLLTFAFEALGGTSSSSSSSPPSPSVEAAIVLESDIELAADGFDFFRWAYGQVAADPRLRARVLNVNGYNKRSGPEKDRFTVSTDEGGFEVWGWLCPRWSWPLLRDGWTRFGNWDINVEEHVRRPNGKVSLSPAVSRTRNIGMQGINFDIRDPNERAKWETLHIPDTPTDFGGRPLHLVPSDAAAIKGLEVAVE
jgi:hypothetical protein